jgi:TolA-binding protein
MVTAVTSQSGAASASSGGTDIAALEQQLATYQKKLEEAEKGSSKTKAQDVQTLNAQIANLQARIAQAQAAQARAAQGAAPAKATPAADSGKQQARAGNANKASVVSADQAGVGNYLDVYA